jgi:hypothetical protein
VISVTPVRAGEGQRAGRGRLGGRGGGRGDWRGRSLRGQCGGGEQEGCAEQRERTEVHGFILESWLRRCRQPVYPAIGRMDNCGQDTSLPIRYVRIEGLFYFVATESL